MPRDGAHHHYSTSVPALPWTPKQTVCVVCGGTESHGKWHGDVNPGWTCAKCVAAQIRAQDNPTVNIGGTFERNLERDLHRKGLLLGPKQKEGYARGIFKPMKRR